MRAGLRAAVEVDVEFAAGVGDGFVLALVLPLGLAVSERERFLERILHVIHAGGVFGNDNTERAAFMMALNHLHEHLGQSVAYARMNGVVPPWSTE